MSFLRSLATLCCVALCATSVMGQEAAQEQEAEEAAAQADVVIGFAQNREQMLTAAVGRELQLASRIAGLSDAAVERIKDGLTGVIKKHANKKDQLRTPSIALGMGSLDDALADEVLKAVKAEVQKDRFKAYQKDVMLRRKFRRDAVIAAFVQSLDANVGLGLDQIEKVNELAGTLYEKGKLSEGIALGMMPAEEATKIDELKTVLTQSQYGFYEEFRRWQPGVQAIVIGADGQPERPDEAKEREKLLKQLRRVAGMKLDYLHRALKLSDQQQSKLRLVSKGVLTSAVDEKMAANKALAEYQERMMAGAAGGAIEAPDPDMITKAMAHPVQVFAAQPRWQEFVKATLTTEQKTQLEKIQQKKGSRTSEVLCSTLVMAFGSEIQLSGQQKIDMRDLLKKHIEVPPGSDGGLRSFNRVETFRALLAVKDTAWIAAMGEDNWEKFRPQLGQLRQEIERREKKSDEQ